MSVLKKYKNSICVSLIIFAIMIYIFKVYNEKYYSIKLGDLSVKNILYYKNYSTANSYIITKFMKTVSNGDYQSAFNMLDKNNKKDMFDNNMKEFGYKMEDFNNSFSELKYFTVFSTETEEYVDEEIISVIVDENGEFKNSIRFYTRMYKNNNEATLIILNIY